VPVEFEPLEPTIEPLLVIVIVVPDDHPVPVYIAAVPLEVEPTVTPELIVKVTEVDLSPPAAIACAPMS
jgi:hypothetical protein